MRAGESPCRHKGWLAPPWAPGLVAEALLSTATLFAQGNLGRDPAFQEGARGLSGGLGVGSAGEGHRRGVAVSECGDSPGCMRCQSLGKKG